MPDWPPVTKRSSEPFAAAELAALALALADALAELAALALLADALEAAELLPPEEQPAKTAAIPAAAPTPMKPLLVKFFMLEPFPFLSNSPYVLGAEALAIPTMPLHRCTN